MNDIDERLSHLTIEEINELIKEYYADIKTSELIDKYKIDITPSRLYTIFPPIVCEDDLCPYCNLPMLLKRSSKSGYSISNKYCQICGHEESVFCKCDNCNKKGNIEKEKREEERRRILDIKKQKIEDVYKLGRYIPVRVKDLTFLDKVYLGALLRSALSEDMSYIIPIGKIEKSLSPTLEYDKKILNTLREKRIILVSPDSDIEAFPDDEDDFPNSFYIYKVRYVLNIDFEGDYEQGIASLLNPLELVEENKEDALDIWREIALEECLEYLDYQMRKVKFKFSPGEKTITIFKDILENFSVSQVYGIIYRSVSNATRYYQESNISKAQASNSVVGGCQRYAERALAESWSLQKYKRAYDIPQSIISEFFFNRVTNIGYLGFDIPPMEL